jgi:hypothetical protein
MVGDIVSGGLVYLSDRENHKIRAINTINGIISHIAGNGLSVTSGDGGRASSAGINGPDGLWLSSSNALYVSEVDSCVIRSFNLVSKIMSRVAGSGVCTSASIIGDGGAATSAVIYGVRQMAADTLGTSINLADYTNHRVRLLDLNTNIITTVAVPVNHRLLFSLVLPLPKRFICRLDWRWICTGIYL